jgi:hypothetical protein
LVSGETLRIYAIHRDYFGEDERVEERLEG